MRIIQFIRRNIFTSLIIFFIVGISVFKIINTHKQKSLNNSALEVTVQKITYVDFPLDFEYPARVAGYKEVLVRSQVSGILLSKNYVEGQYVQQGDLLFIVDPTLYADEVNKAQATLENNKAILAETEKNLFRAQELYKKQVVSAYEVDRQSSLYKQASAAIKSAEAALSFAQTNLEYTNITSPISGVAGKEKYSEGNLINASSPDYAVVTYITQVDPVYVYFSYPESEVYYKRRLINAGKLIVPENEFLVVKAKLFNQIVDSIAGGIDFTDYIMNPHTLTFAARAIMPNDNNALTPGQFITIVIQGIKWKDAVIIDDKAIIETAKGSIVYTVDKNNKVLPKPVILGPLTAQGRIIEDGLQLDELLIVDGIIKARPGMLVNPVFQGQEDQGQKK